MSGEQMDWIGAPESVEPPRWTFEKIEFRTGAESAQNKNVVTVMRTGDEVTELIIDPPPGKMLTLHTLPNGSLIVLLRDKP